MSNFLLNSNHDIIIGRGATRIGAQSAQYVAQATKCNLLSLLGEWEQEPDVGIDWFNSLVNGTIASSQQLELTARDTITSTEGVDVLSFLQITFNSSTRRITITFEATTIYETTITEEVTYGWSLG
jgi:hypothetical protein